jgi:hypothetical protein
MTQDAVAPIDFSRPRGSATTLPLLAGCIALAIMVALLTGLSDSAAHLIGVQSVCALGLAWAAVGAWRHRHRLGLVGALLVAGLLSWFIGNVGWTLNVLVFHIDPYPSWADVCFLLVYPALMTAAMLMVRRREVRRDMAALIDATIVTVGVGVVAYAFLLVDAAKDDSLSLIGRVVGVTYPLCDLLVFGVFLRILLGSTAWSRAGLLLMGAIGCLLIADFGFMLAVFAGASDAYDSWVDALFMLFFLLAGLALQQRDVASLVHDTSPQVERLGPVRMVALGVGALLAPLTLLAGNVASDSLKVRGAAVGAAVMFLLAMARMRQLIQAVERNSDLLQVQARTDALTGLPNRRTFDFELERTAAQAAMNELFQPMSVAMIDLDHFKEFNDAFGHGAGDRLLQQAAAAWRVALLQLAPAARSSRSSCPGRTSPPPRACCASCSR